NDTPWKENRGACGDRGWFPGRGGHQRVRRTLWGPGQVYPIKGKGRKVSISQGPIWEKQNQSLTIPWMGGIGIEITLEKNVIFVLRSFSYLASRALQASRPVRPRPARP